MENRPEDHYSVHYRTELNTKAKEHGSGRDGILSGI
jgi:hypothetical protein